MTRKKGDTISKESCKFKHKINIHPNEENDITTITNQARDIKKTAKLEGLKQIKQNWKANLYIRSTHCEDKTLTETRETPIVGYVVQV